MASLAGVVAGRRVRAARAEEVAKVHRRYHRVAERNAAQREEAQRRSAALQRRGEAADAATRRSVESWFARFDADGNGVIDRAELSELLAHELGAAPTARALDRVMKAAAGGGAGLRPPEVTRAVMAYKGYLAEHAPLDRLFERLDADGSGRLEAPEVLALLRELAPDQPSAEGDADWVLLQLGTDSVDRDGFDRLIPILGTWKHLARGELADGTTADAPLEGIPLEGTPVPPAAAAQPRSSSSSLCAIL